MPTPNKIGKFMVAIGALIVHAETKKVLLVKRSNHAGINVGLWELIYGRIDQFEELEEGLKREVFEETGIKDIEVKKLMNIWHIFRGERKAENEVFGFTFMCETRTEKVKISSEHTMYRWLEIDEAINMKPLLPGLQKQLIKYRDELDTLGTIFISDITKKEYKF